MFVKPPANITSKSLASAFLPHLVLFTLLVTLFHYNKTTSSSGTTTSTHPSSTSTNIDSPPSQQSQQQQQQPPIPPIESLLAPNGTIIGDISWMLDFAIIAFPKSGTTFMKDYLRQSSEVWMYPREFCIKSLEDVERFVRVYYEVRLEHDRQLQLQENNLDNVSMIQYGLKCPGVLYRNDIDIYRRYFHRTKLIVGIRHPISWFESFYNYQMYRNVSTAQMKTMTTTDFVGRCEKHQKVCTDRARFHAALARLGFTRMEGAEELGLLFGWRYENQTNRHHGGENHQQRRRRRRRIIGQDDGVRHPTQRMGVYPSTNQVFIYEVRQIHNSITSKQLSKNIQQYVQIDEALPEISSYTQNKTRAINICDDEHKAVRRVLVEHGKDAADWIQNYFVKSSSVVVSSPESFFDLLNDWKRDPCQENSLD
ncbi:hypothetical protein HJC23_000764 [Cyclotella cryptica]|uniref:Sulfotransferase domain-containing protein n=1 Tax=Cyclotella cryptica TaxID=29204 RepID=A0ABD3PZR5_9STRA|eukprot:CCRYP_010122-RA/>CCRYP_010122-RA protein AED:0.19 eAED:0.19 QI:0/-1/0/1/-1/1/1/0/423